MDPINSVKQEAILKSALELFSEHGFHDAPMAQLAVRANVGVGTIYRYFKDKDGLIQSLYDDVDGALQQAIVEGVDSTLPTQEQFKRFISNLLCYLHAHPAVFKFLEQYYHSPFGLEKKREKLLTEKTPKSSNSFAHLLAEGSGRTIKPLPIPVLHALAFGPVLFLLRDTNAGLVEMNEAVIQMVTDGCWDAIKIDDHLITPLDELSNQPNHIYL